MTKIVAAAVAVPVAAVLAFGGYEFSALGATEDTVGTQTFTNVVTYTIPTVTETVTVTQPPAPPPAPPPPPVPPPPPPPPVCGRTQAGGNLQTFVNSATLGETLCWSGTYASGLTIDNSGFTLRNTPGLTAVLTSGCGGTFCTVAYVHGDNVTWQGFEINGGGTRNCILLGDGGESTPSRVANDDTLSYMRLHACGNDAHEHGVYAEFTNRLHIVDSLIYASGGYGIQFYPEANDTLVEYSVLDGNDTGSGTGANVTFSGETTGGEYSQNHASDRNVIANSNVTFVSPGSNTQNLYTYWPSPAATGTGNIVRDSCVFSPGDAENSGSNPLVTETNITRLDPGYVNRAAGDYTLSAGSPCVGKGPR